MGCSPGMHINEKKKVGLTQASITLFLMTVVFLPPGLPHQDKLSLQTVNPHNLSFFGFCQDILSQEQKKVIQTFILDLKHLI